MNGVGIMESSYYAEESNNQTSWDMHYQRRGRNRERHEYVNSSSEEEFRRGNRNDYYQQPQRRSHSADSRPQYNNNNNNNTRSNHTNCHSYNASPSHKNIDSNLDGFSAFGPSFSNFPSDRGFSDLGNTNNNNGNGNFDSNFDSNSNSNSNPFGLSRLPRYEGVVYDDSILYSRADRRRHWEPDAFIPDAFIPEEQQYNNSQRQQQFGETQNLSAAQQHAVPNNNNNNNNNYNNNNAQHFSLQEEEQQYYHYAKNNLITFGGFDAQTASTGLSQEELLQRKRRENTWQKRKEKRKIKASRILNIPTSLKKTTGDHQVQSLHKQPQQQQQQQQQRRRQQEYGQYQSHLPSSNPQNTAVALNSLHKNDREEITNNRDSNNGRGKGVRGAMVRRQKLKMKRLQRASCSSTTAETEDDTDYGDDVYGATSTSSRRGNSNNGTKSKSYREKDNFDLFMEDPNLLPSNTKKGVLFSPQQDNIDHDYLSLPRVAETTPKTRRNNRRPTYADFTPKSDYMKRDVLSSKHKGAINTDDSSPTSVMNMQMGNGGGVRWNENFMQQEYIFSPQSTKLRFDSEPFQYGSSARKPKSILRHRYSSPYAPKSQKRNPSLASSNGYSSDEIAPPQPTGGHLSKDRIIRSLQGSFRDHPSRMDFIDEPGDPTSPYQTDVFAENPEKFSESYVHFIEAVAAVVIQTKIRQFLAKIRVQKLRNHFQRWTETRMTPSGRDLARRVRHEQKVRGQTRKSSVTLDFYSLAAIQIQAAFRGWWIRDCLAVDNYCAAMIQKVYRGKKRRTEYLYYLYNVVIVQSACRRWIATDAAVTRLYCIVRIQAIMRGALVRNRMGFDSLERNVHDAAAIMIQTQWRSFVCEMNFLREYEDVLVIQSIVRRWLAKRRVRSLQKERHAKTTRQTQSGSRFKSLSRFKPRKQSSPAYSHSTASANNASIPERKQKFSPSYSPHSPHTSYANNASIPERKQNSSPAYSPHTSYANNASIPEMKQKSSAAYSPHTSYANNASIPERKQNSSPAYSPHTSYANNSSMPERKQKSSAAYSPHTSYANNASMTERKQKPLNSTPASFGIQRGSTPRNEEKLPERPDSHEMSITDETTQPSKWESRKSGSNSRGQFDRKVVNNEVETTEVKDFRTESKNVSASRANIERRRKEREEEAKAQKEEANRRHEIQAAEMAELQSRRRAMVLKAEARKKEEEEEAAAQTSNIMSQTRNSEKKADTKTDVNKTDSKSRKPADASFGTSRKNSYKLNPAKTERTNTVEPETVVNTGRKNSGFSKTKGESLVAKRMRELKEANDGSTSTEKDDVAVEENSNAVTEKPSGNASVEKFASHRPSQTADNTPSKTISGGTKEASSIPVAKQPEIGSNVPKRRSKTNGKYQEYMRSLRSETEQKRIDDIHLIFQQAGLFLRTKRA